MTTTNLATVHLVLTVPAGWSAGTGETAPLCALPTALMELLASDALAAIPDADATPAEIRAHVNEQLADIEPSGSWSVGPASMHVWDPETQRWRYVPGAVMPLLLDDEPFPHANGNGPAFHVSVALP